MTLTLDIEFQCLRKLKLLNITNNSSMTIIINLVYCCVLNINAEFNLPSKYQICVLVLDDSFCGKWKTKLCGDVDLDWTVHNV